MLKRKPITWFPLMIAMVAMFASVEVGAQNNPCDDPCTAAEIEAGTCGYMKWGDGSGTLQDANWMVRVYSTYDEVERTCYWSYLFCPKRQARDVSHLNFLAPHDCDDSSFDALFYSETSQATLYYDGVGTDGEDFGLGIIDHDAWKLDESFRANKSFTVEYRVSGVDGCISNKDCMALLDAKLGFLRGDLRVIAQACPPDPCPLPAQRVEPRTQCFQFIAEDDPCRPDSTWYAEWTEGDECAVRVWACDGIVDCADVKTHADCTELIGESLYDITIDGETLTDFLTNNSECDEGWLRFVDEIGCNRRCYVSGGKRYCY